MKTDRDGSMDKLLASTLKASRVDTQGDAHLDAETLAAWADGALDASERASAEAHAAGCARCQQLLAAMVRTLPEPEAAKSRWRMPALGWLVPLTAAATALAVWIAVPKPSPVQVSSGETAVDALTAPPARERSLAAPAEPETTERARVPRPEELQMRVQQRAVPVQPEAGPVERDRLDTRALDKDMKQESADAKAKAPALADSASNLARAEAPALAAPAPAAPPAAAQTGARAATAEAGARLGAVSGAVAAPSRMAFATGPDVIVVSSNPSTRFRLRPGGGVQRSADAGSTWRTEVSGTTETLRAGSSPSPSVCWLVGGAGTVLLSTDGRSWRRLAFPETVDLLSVAATDQDNASVTTADGRVFVTADGGQSWSRAPGF
jgi:Putative zinc-finger